MNNKEIKKLLKHTADLMVLHDENPFVVRTYTNASIRVDNLAQPLAQVDRSEIPHLEGIGKGIAADIGEILDRGSFSKLDALLEKTPEGLLEILMIKGVGPGKVRTLWRELSITTPEALLEACRQGEVAALKGFGKKTEETIRKAIEYTIANRKRSFYSVAETVFNDVSEAIHAAEPGALVEMGGHLRRRYEVIDAVEVVCGTGDRKKIIDLLDGLNGMKKMYEMSGPFRWGGVHIDTNLDVFVYLTSKASFYNVLLMRTGSEEHLNALADGDRTLLRAAREAPLESEAAAYEMLHLPYVIPEMREGTYEIELCRENKVPDPITMTDLKGSIHNHSTYSDGTNTLEEMAGAARKMGLQYLGMADHSQTAFYAGGLKEQDIIRQHREIEALNDKLKPFRIFKGIESDILNDGSLDYPQEVLDSFDFVVASVHSGLNMDVNKATGRLLGAIQHPSTTILGHPTGRLLLNREGYPIDHKAIINACVKHGVVIEINANPWRLDLDWRWIRYGIDQGAMFSINPDAHETIGLHDMYYGVCVARKAGLTADRVLNAMDVERVEDFFRVRKSKVSG